MLEKYHRSDWNASAAQSPTSAYPSALARLTHLHRKHTVHLPAFPAQHDVDPQIAKARARMSDLANPQSQGGLIRKRAAVLSITHIFR
jgi:hypothetical protein